MDNDAIEKLALIIGDADCPRSGWSDTADTAMHNRISRSVLAAIQADPLAYGIKMSKFSALDKAVRDREKACVNALSGVSDPEGFMRDVLDVNEGKISTGHFMNKLAKHLKGGSQ